MTDCLSCTHAAVTADPTGKIDFNRKMCIKGPPTPIPVPGPAGVQVMAMFPLVGKGIRCDGHTPRSDVMVPPPDFDAAARELLGKVGHEGWDDAEVMIVAAALRKAATV